MAYNLHWCPGAPYFHARARPRSHEAAALSRYDDSERLPMIQKNDST